MGNIDALLLGNQTTVLLGQLLALLDLLASLSGLVLADGIRLLVAIFPGDLVAMLLGLLVTLGGESLSFPILLQGHLFADLFVFGFALFLHFGGADLLGQIGAGLFVSGLANLLRSADILIGDLALGDGGGGAFLLVEGLAALVVFGGADLVLHGQALLDVVDGAILFDNGFAEFLFDVIIFDGAFLGFHWGDLNDWSWSRDLDNLDNWGRSRDLDNLDNWGRSWDLDNLDWGRNNMLVDLDWSWDHMNRVLDDVDWGGSDQGDRSPDHVDRGGLDVLGGFGGLLLEEKGVAGVEGQQGQKGKNDGQFHCDMFLL